jgi:hypothetical protein
MVCVADLNIFTLEQMMDAMGSRYSSRGIQKALAEQGLSDEEISKRCKPRVFELMDVSVCSAKRKA